MALPRLPDGWHARGDLPEIEDPASTEFGLLDEDLLQVSDPSGQLILDAGWYPAGDPSGRFRCQAIYKENWDDPIDEFEARDSADVIGWFENHFSHSSEVLGNDAQISNEAIVSVFIPIVMELPSTRPNVDDLLRNHPDSATSQYGVKKREPEEIHAS